MHRATLDATGPLNQDGSLAYRLNMLGEGGDSFRDDVESERYDVAPVISWQVNDATKLIFEGDFMRNNHPLDRGLTRLPGQLGTASRDTNIWEKGSDNLLHNDNNMAQLRFEHLLNDNWTWAAACSGWTARSKAMPWRLMACSPTAAPLGATSTTVSWSGPTAITSSTLPATSTPAASPTRC